MDLTPTERVVTRALMTEEEWVQQHLATAPPLTDRRRREVLRLLAPRRRGATNRTDQTGPAK